MRLASLPLRIIGGAFLVLLMIFSLLQPMLSPGECAALIALGNTGKPYVFGSPGPDSYDCSGLTRSAYGLLGYELLHSAQLVGYDNQYQTIESASGMRTGDLIFFDTVRDQDACDHVGIWLGANRFVHASSSEKVVMVSELDSQWLQKYSWGKRIA